jgi:thiamine biosynthesis lipoprotein
MTAREHERRMELFGSRVRVLVGTPAEENLLRPELAGLGAEVFLHMVHRRLSRFDPASELSRLNAAATEEVEVSALTARAVEAALWAAEATGGLVDPTLVGELEDAGYARSRVGLEPAPLAEALPAAPPRRPARPRQDERWRLVTVEGRTVRRPPGLRLDFGGTAKGLAAELCAARLAGYSSFAVDAGGDVFMGGKGGLPRLVEVEWPLPDHPPLRFELVDGAVATSGIASRVWRDERGFSHHLIDPASGRPAWTGVVQATALASSGVAAEALAKAAVLSGPEAGLELLEHDGGLLVLDDGTILRAGCLRDPAAVAA